MPSLEGECPACGRLKRARNGPCSHCGTDVLVDPKRTKSAFLVDAPRLFPSLATGSAAAQPVVLGIGPVLRSCDALLVRFSEHDSLTSGCIGGLVTLHRMASLESKRVILVVPNRSMRDVFEITRTSARFEIYEDEDAALEQL